MEVLYKSNSLSGQIWKLQDVPGSLCKHVAALRRGGGGGTAWSHPGRFIREEPPAALHFIDKYQPEGKKTFKPRQMRFQFSPTDLKLQELIQHLLMWSYLEWKKITGSLISDACVYTYINDPLLCTPFTAMLTCYCLSSHGMKMWK